MSFEEICGFEHLHQHTEFSLLDGFAKPEELAERAVNINQKYLCISDHGMMGAIPRQIRTCEENNLSPIFAVELYVNPNQPDIQKVDMTDMVAELPDFERKAMKKSCHLLAIAYNDVGFINLVKLSSWGYTNGFYYKPRVNHEQLLLNKEGIIFTSCCYMSEIGQAFDQGGEEAGFAMIEKYMAMFGEYFYLEIMLLDFHKQKPYDAFILKAHNKYHIPIICTNDCHYCYPEDSHYQRLMLMVQTKRTLKDIEQKLAEDATADLFELQDQNLWMKSEAELNDKWNKDYQDIIDLDLFKQAKRNTVSICEKAKGVTFDRSNKLPKLPNANEVLKEYIVQGIKIRNIPNRKVYSDRIKEEYELICRKDFASYFLIQKMMTDEARRVCPEILGWGSGWEATGPGRGCLAPFTKIMVKDGGCKYIKDVQIGDYVLTIDGSWRQVLEVFRYEINEPLVQIKSYYGDDTGVTLTLDHKIFVEKGIRPKNWDKWSDNVRKHKRSYEIPKGKPDWLPASDVEKGDWVFVPKMQDQEQCKIVVDLAKYSDPDNHLWHDDQYVYHDWMHPSKKLRVRKKINRYITLDQDWFSIIGLFAGDGWLKRRNDPLVGFCFHSDEFYTRSLVKFKFASIGVEEKDFYEKIADKKKVRQLIVKNRFIQKWFKDMFSMYECTSQTKHVPSFIFSMCNADIMSFLKGYFLSDGTQGQYKAAFDTSSPVLADQTRHLLLRNSIPSSMKKSVRFDRRFGKYSTSFKITIPHVEGITHNDAKKRYVYHPIHDGLMLKVKEIECIDDVKEVFDLRVEGNHNYMTSTCLVHNSGVSSIINYLLGITDVDPIKHGLLFSRFMSPARGGRQIKLHRTKDTCPLTSGLVT